MKTNKIILAFFVKKNFLESILNYLLKIKINEDDIFIYQILENDIEYLISIRFNDNNTDKLSNHKYIKPIHVHIKNGCLFSINALNKFIGENNINTNDSLKNTIVDWNILKNKLLFLKNNELSLSNLQKIGYDRCGEDYTFYKM
jgi:hypothetical protein